MSPAEVSASLRSSRWTGRRTRWWGCRSSCWPAPGLGTWRSTPVEPCWLSETKKATVSSWSGFNPQIVCLFCSSLPHYLITPSPNPTQRAEMMCLGESGWEHWPSECRSNKKPIFRVSSASASSASASASPLSWWSGGTTTPGEGPVQPSFLAFFSNEW